MTFISTKEDVGIWVLQDHRTGDVKVGRRAMIAGTRVVDPDDPWSGYVLDDKGRGTIGDIHPWRWWEPNGRDCGLWNQAQLCVVTDAAGRTSRTDPTMGVSVRPIKKEDYAPAKDMRDVAQPTAWFWPVPAGGTVLLGAAGTETQREAPIAGWADPRLVAANAARYDDMGSLVCDLGPPGQLSVKRVARLQTHLRVAHVPSLSVLGTDEGWSAAWNLGPTGIGRQSGLGTVYGLADNSRAPATTPGSGSSSGPPGTTVPGRVSGPGDAATGFRAGGAPSVAAVALASWVAYGPLCPGHAEDVHQLARNEDGEPVNSLHLHPDRTLWFRRQDRDAPLEFSVLDYGPGRAPYRVEASIRYDPKVRHAWLDRDGPGMWRLESQCWWTGKGGGPPPPPTPPPPTTPPDVPPTIPPPSTPGSPIPTPPGIPFTPWTPGSGDDGGDAQSPGQVTASGDPTAVVREDNGPWPTENTGIYPVVPAPLEGWNPLNGATPEHLKGKEVPGGWISQSGVIYWWDPVRHGWFGRIGPVQNPPGFIPPLPPGYAPVTGRAAPSPAAGIPVGKTNPVTGRPSPGPTGAIPFPGGVKVLGPRGARAGGTGQPSAAGSGGGGASNTAAGLVGQAYIQRRSQATSYQDLVAYTSQALGVASLLAFPQHLGRVGTDFRFAICADPEEEAADRATRPAVARLEAWGAESGTSWDYTVQPDAGRTPGGTACGGIVILPPEVDLLDGVDSYAPGGVSLSTAYFATGPGAYFASGSPDRTTGDMENQSIRWYATGGSFHLDVKSAGIWTAMATADASGWLYAQNAGDADTVDGKHATDFAIVIDEDQPGGHAGLNGDSRVTKGVITTDDLIVNSATKGVVLKDSDGHFWRVTVDTSGVLDTTDLGTSPP